MLFSYDMQLKIKSFKNNEYIVMYHTLYVYIYIRNIILHGRKESLHFI